MYMNLEVENVKNELILHNKFKNQQCRVPAPQFARGANHDTEFARVNHTQYVFYMFYSLSVQNAVKTTKKCGIKTKYL